MHMQMKASMLVCSAAEWYVAMQVDIATPEVFIGGLLGAMLVFLFSAWAIIAVGRSAQAVVNEVNNTPRAIVSSSYRSCHVGQDCAPLLFLLL